MTPAMGKPPANTQVRFWRDPDLPGVEMRFSNYNQDAFRDHKHEAFSVAIILTGRTVFMLEGSPHKAGAGQIALIPERAVHACNPAPDSVMSYYTFYLDSALLKDAAREALGPEAPMPVFSPVVDDDDLFAQWRDLTQAISEGASRLEKQSRLVQCLSETITRHARRPARNTPAAPLSSVESDNADAVAKTVAKHLEENLATNITLDQLAELTGLSRFHLLRLFKEQTGLPPHAYQNQLRVDQAKTLLASGMAISQVAPEVGFTDQSHLTRIFKQYTGATPRQYQAAEAPKE